MGVMYAIMHHIKPRLREYIREAWYSARSCIQEGDDRLLASLPGHVCRDQHTKPPKMAHN